MKIDIVNDVKFIGGCSGNTQGVGALAKGMKVSEVIERLKGIRCAAKSTSCPDQFAKALMKHTSSGINHLVTTLFILLIYFSYNYLGD